MTYEIGDPVQVRIRGANLVRRLRGRIAGRQDGPAPLYQVELNAPLAGETPIYVGEDDLKPLVLQHYDR